MMISTNIFEIMLALKANTPLSYCEFLTLARESIEIEAACPDDNISLYSTDIYDHEDNGSATIKVLVTSDLDQQSLAESIMISFNDDRIISTTFSQIREC